MRKANEKVIQDFLNGQSHDVQSHTGNLYVSHDGSKLMNYNTCLAQFTMNGLVLNKTKYSSTTSKIQTMINRNVYTIPQYVENVPMNAHELTKYLIEVEK